MQYLGECIANGVCGVENGNMCDSMGNFICYFVVPYNTAVCRYLRQQIDISTVYWDFVKNCCTKFCIVSILHSHMLSLLSYAFLMHFYVFTNEKSYLFSIQSKCQ